MDKSVPVQAILTVICPNCGWRLLDIVFAKDAYLTTTRCPCGVSIYAHLLGEVIKLEVTVPAEPHKVNL